MLLGQAQSNLEDVETDVAVVVHVWVVAGSGESDGGGRVGIAGGEGEGELVVQPSICSAFCPSYGGHPVEQVVAVREGGDARVARHLRERRQQWRINESRPRTISFMRSCWSRFVTEWPSLGADKQLPLALEEEGALEDGATF